MRRALAWLALCVSACIVRPDPPGRIQVEVYRGMGGNAAGSFHPSIALLIDARESMGASAAHVTRLEAAKLKAHELLAALPAGTRASLHALGSAASTEECGGLARGARDAAPDAAELAADLASLTPAGRGSLAAALTALREDLIAEGRARDTRVVVLTDLGESPDCPGDLCLAAANLIDAGAWLDVALIGDAAAPACLDALRPSAQAPSSLLRALTRPPARWALAPTGGAEPILRGSAGPLELEAPPGEWELAVELDPPLPIAPLQIRSGRTTRVRVLDFPGGPPRYAWEVLDEQR